MKDANQSALLNERHPISTQADSHTTKLVDPAVDWFIFVLGAGILFSVVLPIVIAPEWSAGAINQTFEFLTTRFGVLYVVTAVGTIMFLLWLACSRYGRLQLGSGDTEYNEFAWASMLFCAGIGASLIYWGAAEWVYYYTDPPMGIEPRSDEALVWAAGYGIFHWGPIGWALYCLPAIALGCSFYIQKIPRLRLSAACSSVLGRWSEGWLGRIIDLFFVVGLLGTAATGLGFGTSVVSAAMHNLTGWPDNIQMQFGVIGVVTLMVAYSVFRGMDRGIRVLSLWNAVLAIGLVLMVFLAGPWGFILEMAVTSVGQVLQHFVAMSTWTDPMRRGDFVENWTVFYWAWWIALGPFVGMFVCRISAGRTIRQVIFGMLGWGTMGCVMFFTVLGGYAMHLELSGIYGVIDVIQSEGPATAIAAMIGGLPLGTFWLIYLAVIGLIFTATTYDSASYTLAVGASRSLTEGQHPVMWQRVFWALILGLLPMSLLFLGGLRVLQTASIVASLPLIVIYVVMALAIIRVVRAQFVSVSSSASG